ncbi:MAG TPA: DUF4157 domain-containing protein [Mycobacterium sp.]
MVAGATVKPQWSLSDVSIFPPPQSGYPGSGVIERGEEGEEHKETRASQRQASVPAGAPQVVNAVLRSRGVPLDAATRAFMEPRFGHDFSRVRVHADVQAANSARAVNALAYTVGNDLVFGDGQHAPHTGPGRKLLAHELAHTVQQSRGGTASNEAANLPISKPGDGAERQADAAAEQVAKHFDRPQSGTAPPLALSPVPGIRLQRQAAAPASGPAEQELGRKIHEAAAQAAQKVREKGLDKLPDHVATAPQQRREPETPRPAEPATHLPPENLLPPDPRAKGAIPPDNATPVKPTETTPSAPVASKPDPGSREAQLALGIAAQSASTQAGEVVQGALQDKNYVPGIAVDFLHYFHLQLGILQPTLTLQLTHLKPVEPGSGSAASPLPPPETAQLGGTFSPAVLKVGDFTIAPQIGLATALAGDVFGETSGPGKSGTHGQALGVINLQVDYKLSERASLTGAIGTQGGLDIGPQGTKGVGNVTGSFVATFHF